MYNFSKNLQEFFPHGTQSKKSAANYLQRIYWFFEVMIHNIINISDTEHFFWDLNYFSVSKNNHDTLKLIQSIVPFYLTLLFLAETLTPQRIMRGINKNSATNLFFFFTHTLKINPWIITLFKYNMHFFNY